MKKLQFLRKYITKKQKSVNLKKLKVYYSYFDFNLNSKSTLKTTYTCMLILIVLCSYIVYQIYFRPHNSFMVEYCDTLLNLNLLDINTHLFISFFF
jgi:hypothetical protein